MRSPVGMVITLAGVFVSGGYRGISAALVMEPSSVLILGIILVVIGITMMVRGEDSE